MAKQTTDAVTEDDIQAARVALAEGHAELTRLNEAFLDGRDDVEWSAVQSQKAVIEYAEARIEQLARQKARYEESLRQVELGKVRAEMDGYEAKVGSEFVDLLKAVEVATLAFASAHVAHNKAVAGWRERMVAAGVKPVGNALSTHAADQGLSFSDAGSVRAGQREFVQVFSGQVLQELLLALRGIDGIGKEYFESEHVGYPSLEDLYARVGVAARELPGIPDDALFYRHSNGSVHMRGAQQAFPAEDMKRLELTQITRSEAVAE